MNVLLVAPPQRLNQKRLLGEYSFPAVPLGLAYIAGVLESNGFSCSILDLSFQEAGLAKLNEKLSLHKPEIVGITSMTSTFQNASAVAKAVKQRCPSTLVVMGGVHPTFTAAEILASIPEVDVIVLYEGEQTMLELADSFEGGRNLRPIKGISFREKGKIISSPFRERISDLDSLPFPAYHLLEPSIEEYMKYLGKRNLPVITTRGCPFGCIYCSTMAFHGKKYRTRSIRNVVGELEWLIKEFDVNSISFLDDNFTMQNERVYAICSEIKNKNLAVEWGCNTRVDQVSKKLLKAMKDAGCKDIFFGIESVSQRVLNIAKKGYSTKQAKDAVKAAEELGIRTHCSFVMGLPGESAYTLGNMVRFVDEVKPTGRVIPNLLVTFPGTELFEKKAELFLKRSPVSLSDITKTQLQMLTTFYENNCGAHNLLRVVPPNIIVE